MASRTPFQWRERTNVVLYPDGTHIVGRFHSKTGALDAERLCGIAVKFMDDPEAVAATSGTRCISCGRALTDPESRARGIGPECFGEWGDFLRHIEPAPASLD